MIKIQLLTSDGHLGYFGWFTRAQVKFTRAHALVGPGVDTPLNCTAAVVWTSTRCLAYDLAHYVSPPPRFESKGRWMTHGPLFRYRYVHALCTCTCTFMALRTHPLCTCICMGIQPWLSECCRNFDVWVSDSCNPWSPYWPRPFIFELSVYEILLPT